MQNKLQTLLSRRNLHLFAFATICVVGSFLIGIQSAGDIKPVLHTEAQPASVLSHTPTEGDIDGDGQVTLQDVVDLLQMIQRTRPLTQQSIAADPDHDGELTVSDAIAIIDRLNIP